MDLTSSVTSSPDLVFARQHLERVHSEPVHCPKCYSIFRNNPEARDKHVRQGACHNAPERRLEGIDEATMRKLKRRVTGKSVGESWYSIFTLLFPGARKPESPCKSTLDQSTANLLLMISSHGHHTLRRAFSLPRLLDSGRTEYSHKHSGREHALMGPPT